MYPPLFSCQTIPETRSTTVPLRVLPNRPASDTEQNNTVETMKQIGRKDERQKEMQCLVPDKDDVR